MYVLPRVRAACSCCAVPRALIGRPTHLHRRDHGRGLLRFRDQRSPLAPIVQSSVQCGHHWIDHRATRRVRAALQSFHVEIIQPALTAVYVEYHELNARFTREPLPLTRARVLPCVRILVPLRYDFPWQLHNIVPFGLLGGPPRHEIHHREGRVYMQKFGTYLDALFGYVRREEKEDRSSKWKRLFIVAQR